MSIQSNNAAGKPRRRTAPSYALLSVLLVPIVASCFRLGMMMMTFHATQQQPEAPASITTPAIEQAISSSTIKERHLGTKLRQSVRRPFLHGVASGDPTSSAVIIWTRVTTKAVENAHSVDAVSVIWQMATDRDFGSVVASGSETATADQDYTVKIDVTGLESYTFYYYKFTYCSDGGDERSSPTCVDSVTGRTKTAPSAAIQQLRFATVSCSSYQWGYFHAYDRITERDDVDAVLHVGDYIYEYGDGEFGDVRSHDPPTAAVTLDDYRRRYAQYRSDASLRNLHQIQPFITTWDDHEFANNAYRGGSNNHDPATEGAWIDRRRAAAQAYREWLPFRVTDNGDTDAISVSDSTEEEDDNSNHNNKAPWSFNLYRKFAYGNLVDIFVLDNRIVGRDEQGGLGAQLMFLPEYYDPNRDLLGPTQMAWLKTCLTESTAQWKVLMQPILLAPATIKGVVAHNEDAWDGYAADRAELMGYIYDNEIDNVVVLSGDIHASLVSDIPKEKTVDLATYGDWFRRFPSLFWKPSSSYTSIAVEFVVTSVTSVTQIEDSFLGMLPGGIQLADFVLQTAGLYLNPHGEFIDTLNRGYQIIDFQTDKVQTNIYFTGSAEDKTDSVPVEDQYQTSFFSLDGDNFVQESSDESVALRNGRRYRDG